jgi:UDP-glucose 4-epimerase
VVSIFAARVAAGELLTVHGAGTQTRDFVFVADAVAHLLGAMRHLAVAGGCEVLNVCTGHGTSVLELVHLLARLHDRTARVQHGPARAGDITRSVGDPSEAIATIGVHATTPLREGLAATLAWLPA